MTEKKKQKSAAFAQEKNTFTGEIPKKANEGKGKNPQHISREMQIPLLDTMSRGRKIQRSIRKQMLLDRMSKSPRGQKPEKSPKVILCSRTVRLRRKPERNKAKNISAKITATGTPIIRHRKKAGIKGGR